MKRPPALALCLLALLGLAACATSASRPDGRSPASPHVRCLTDPRESGTRPLIFLFCIESP